MDAPADFPGGERLWHYVRAAPKAELHIHIEGTLEPELMFKIAGRNGVAVEGTAESHRNRRENFKDLQDFLDLYYSACDVLRTEQDFRDLMYAYLQRASLDNVYVAEIFFDPQTHTARGVTFDTVISGLYRGILEGHRDFEIRASLIMCFLRHLSEEDALETLESVMPHLDKILGVGLDSGEVGNPPSKFRKVYQKAANLGLKLVAHAGEEAGPDYIIEALDLLKVKRVDHGVQCLRDPTLVERLVKESIPLTTCPLSNNKLQVKSRFFGGNDVTGQLLQAGLKVTINSDDPAYFGGYVNDNYLRTVSECKLTEQDVYNMCRNSFSASFLTDIDKASCISRLNYCTVASGYAPPPRSISIFGSRSPQPGSPRYEEARAIARLLASHGYTIITGGYHGIMEAGAHGGSEGMEQLKKSSAKENGSECDQQQVCGVLVPSVFAQREALGNPYLTQPFISRSLISRLDFFSLYSEYFLVCKGTIGTIAELFFVWKCASVRRMIGRAAPKILILRSKFEEPLERFAEEVGIFAEDRDLVTYVDSGDEVLKLVEEDMKKRTAAATITISTFP